MADTIDDAQSYNEHHQEVSMRNFREGLDPARQPGYADWDKETCVDCGEAIPLQRVEMQRCRCVPCQQDLEARQKLTRHNIVATDDEAPRG